MRLMALIALFFTSVLLIGCAAHSKSYLKKDKSIASLVVPSDVPVIKQAPYYPIPKVADQGVVKSVSLKPPTLLSSH